MPIRVIVADDPDRFLQTDLLVWADGRSSFSTETLLSPLAPERRFAAVTDDEDADPLAYAGVYGVYELQLTVPGPRHTLRRTPVAGLTFVGVHPDERRRGVLTAMIRDHFERTAAADASGISVLHASEAEIYGRFGYGVASVESKATFSKGTTFTAPGLEDEAAGIRTRLFGAQDDGVPARMLAAAERAAMTAHGQVTRELRTYEGFAMEPADTLREKEPQQVLLALQDGVEVGYALFRRQPKWEDPAPKGTVSSHELIGTPAAQLALVRRLVDVDLMTTTEVYGRGRDDLLRDWTGTARATHGPLIDSVWLRLVDLPKAMAARGYAGQGDIVLEVTDDVLPEQGGRWRLVSREDGVGRAERTDARPDVSLTTQQLGAAYLGDGSLPRLLRAGLLTQHRSGAVTALDTLLRMPSAPTAAVGF